MATDDPAPYEDADLPSDETFTGLQSIASVDADSYWIDPELVPSALDETYLPFYKQAMDDGDVLVFIAPPDRAAVVSLFGIVPQIQLDGSPPKAVYLWQTESGDVRVGTVSGGAGPMDRISIADYLYRAWQHRDHVNRDFPNSQI